MMIYNDVLQKAVSYLRITIGVGDVPNMEHEVDIIVHHLPCNIISSGARPTKTLLS